MKKVLQNGMQVVGFILKEHRYRKMYIVNALYITLDKNIDEMLFMYSTYLKC